MTIDLHTALVVCALLGAVVLVMGGGSRLVPMIALLACALEALIVFRVIQLSMARLRIDVILPAVLVVTGGLSWSRASGKAAVTASTVIAIVGLIQLLQAIHVFR